MEVVVPVVVGVVACCILFVPVFLQALHVDLTACPLEQGDHGVVTAVALADEVVAVGVGVVGIGLHPDHLVEFYLRVDHTAEALLVGVGHSTRLSAVGERGTHVGSVADRGDADHVVLRDTRLEEVADVVGLRYPGRGLAVAVELRGLDADVKAGTPRFVPVVTRTATSAVCIGEAVGGIDGKVLVAAVAAAVEFVVVFVAIVTLTVAVL